MAILDLPKLATKHNPRPPSPERIEEHRARMAAIDPETALSNLLRGLEDEPLTEEQLARAGNAWEAWEDERDPVLKTKLQLELALHVAGLLEHAEAMSKLYETARTVIEVIATRGGAGSRLARGALVRLHLESRSDEDVILEKTKAKKAVYIAHPCGVGSDREDNLARAARWVAWAAECGVAPIADWILIGTAWNESRRDQALIIDFELLARCDEIWLVGGRISPGMKAEVDVAREKGISVRDLTHLGAEPPLFDSGKLR